MRTLACNCIESESFRLMSCCIARIIALAQSDGSYCFFPMLTA